MASFAERFRRYLPENTAEKAQVGSTLARLQGVHELLADTVEAVKDLDVVEALGEASPWAEAVGSALGDALPPVRFVLKLFSELGKVDDPDDLGYLAATLAYQRAVEQALPEVLESIIEGKVKEPAVKVRKKALADLREAAPPESYDFSRFSFSTAFQHPFIQDADRFLEISAEGLGLDESRFRRLQHQVHLRFVPNLKGILSHGKTRERFAPFKDLMALDTVEARAQDALLEHADYQRWLFEEKRVLGREPFTLRQVYAETECGILRWEDIRKSKGQHGAKARGERVDPFDEQHGGRHPLVTTILDLIADPSFKDAIVIQGVAGSGKSSLTLRLAWEMVRLGLRPIRVELKHLDTRESSAIEEALPEAVHLTEEERTPEADQLVFGKELFLDGAIFKENIRVRGTKICPYVLILDGWDEISVGASEGYQQQVERMLKDVRREFLEQRGFPVRVILTGRPTDAVEGSKFLRDDTRLLTLRNLSSTKLEDYVGKVRAATAEAVERGEPSWSLAEVQELPQVLERYRREYDAQRQEQRGPAPAGGSLEILGLPLLAHLALRLLAEQPENAGQLLEDTTSLYRSLVDLVIGQAGKPAEADFDVEATSMLAGDDLRELLRGTAEAMTALGEESIARDELAIRLNLEDDELARRVDNLTSEQILSRLMISFFFRGGRRQLGAEFSHKSFREYLFAEQVVEELKRYGREARSNLPERDKDLYWQDFPDDDERKQLCYRLAELLGPVWMTPEVAHHLRSLLSWEIARASDQKVETVGDPTEPLSPEQWERVRDGLADAWDWWGEGVHLRPQPKRKSGYRDYEYESPVALRIVEDARARHDKRLRPTPARTTTIDAHLGDGLSLITAALHSGIALENGWSADSEGREVETAEELPVCRRYQAIEVRVGTLFVLFAPSGPERQYFSYYCARINAGGYRPMGVFPRGAFLSRVFLRGAYLTGADISRADLRGAILRGVSLVGSLLENADLTGTDLRESNARGAYLVGSKLSGAQLAGTSLLGAVLYAADLSGADLSGADLRRADLRRADLNGVSLSRADVRGAWVYRDELEFGKTEGAIGLESVLQLLPAR